MLDPLFGQTLTILERSLDVRMTRQNLIAANIANSETPGYRATDVDFENTMAGIVEHLRDSDSPLLDMGGSGLARAMSAGNKGLDVDDLILVTDDAPTVGSDSNTVSMEREVAKLQENRVLYTVTAQLLGQRIRQISESISRMGGV